MDFRGRDFQVRKVGLSESKRHPMSQLRNAANNEGGSLTYKPFFALPDLQCSALRGKSNGTAS